MVIIVSEILKQFKIPFNYIIRPEINGRSPTVISFHFFGKAWSYYGDGKGKEFEQSLQIDVFYLRDIKNLENEIIEKFENNRFKFTGATDTVETVSGNKMYHKVLTFNFLESEVKA